MKKLRTLFLLALTLVMCFGVSVQAQAASIKLSSTSKTVEAGDSFNLSIKNTGSKSVSWSTSNKKVATIKKVSKTKYKVTGAKAGTATITAKVSGKKYTCKVTVKEPKLNKTSASVSEYKTFTLSVSGASSGIKKWETSDSSIASLAKSSDTKYTVKGKKAGSATITVTTKNGKKLKCKVTVTKATSPILSTTSKSIKKGKTFDLTLKGNKGTPAWKVSDSSVASISKVSSTKYTVKGKKAGSATVKVTVDGKTLSCKVKVSNEKQGIIFIGDSRTVMMNEAVGISKKSNQYVYAKVGEGYRYMKNTIEGQVAKCKKNHPSVDKWIIISNMGVNDCGYATNSYIKEYKSLKKGAWKNDTLILESVNPIKKSHPGGDPVTKSMISSFNKKIKSYADGASGVRYLNVSSYLKKTGFTTTDGLHYNNATSKKIYNYIMDHI